MKTFLSKYLFPLAALAALIAYLLCHFQEKRCIDPITTYEVRPDGLLIEPDSTIAGVTQVKIKVTTLDSLGATLLDTTIAPGQRVISPPPPQNTTVRVAQRYLGSPTVSAAPTLITTEDGNFQLRGGIIVVDVVIRPVTPEDPYADDFADCCNPVNGTQFHSALLVANSPHTFNWDGFVIPSLNVMKITVNGGGSTVTFVVIYDTSVAGSKPIILGPCSDNGSGTGFSNCDANMTTMYNSASLNFSIRFFKINGTDMQVEILPRNDGNMSAHSCTSGG